MHNGKTIKLDTRILTKVKSINKNKQFPIEFEIDTNKKLSELFPMLPSNVVLKLQQKLDKLASYSNSHSYSGGERPQKYYDGVNALANMLVKELNKLGYNVEAGEGDDDTIEII